MGTDEIQYKNEIEQFKKNGFVHIKNFFNVSDVLNIKKNLSDYMDRAPDPGNFKQSPVYEKTKMFDNLPMLDQHCQFFHQLKNENRLNSLVSKLMDKPGVPQHWNFFNKIPKFNNGTIPHQDSILYLIKGEDALAVWVPLQNINQDGGGMFYITKSHIKGRRQHKREQGPLYLSLTQDDLENEIVIEPNMGDIVIHHCLTVHGSKKNTSDRERWAITLPFFAESSSERITMKTYEELAH